MKKKFFGWVLGMVMISAISITSFAATDQMTIQNTPTPVAATDDSNMVYDTELFATTTMPSDFKVSNTATGATLQWSAVPGAEKYRVYYKYPAFSNTWEIMGDTSRTKMTTTIVDMDQPVSYTVRVLSDSSTVATTDASLDQGAVKSVYVPQPDLVSIGSSAKGVTIKWKETTHTESYKIYRTTGSSWDKVGSVKCKYYDPEMNLASFTDKTAVSGMTYHYMVRAYNTVDGVSYHSGYEGNGLEVRYLTPPILKAITNNKNGISVSWDAVEGAASYNIYRKTGSGKWSQIDSVTGGDTCKYVDTTAESGKVYTYTVRACNGKMLSSYDSNGLSLTRLNTLKLTAVAIGEKGVGVKWSAVDHAYKYTVYYKKDGGSWTKYVNTTKTNKTVPGDVLSSGKHYYFTVRAVAQDGSLSAYDKVGLDMIYLSTPKLNSARMTTSGKGKITWDRVTGAESYKIYRKTANSSWKAIGTSTTTSYSDTTGKAGTTYYYTVRALKGTSKSYYDKTGISLKWQ